MAEMRNCDEDTVPLPSRQSLSVDFLENRVSIPEFTDETGCQHFKYDPEQQAFVPRLIARRLNREFESPGNGQRLKAATGSFMEAVQIYRTSAKNDPFAKIQFGPSCNWKTVMKTVQDAGETYFSRRSTRGKVRFAFRKIGDNIEVIKPFLDLLPQGDYQILCGGLQIATGALIRNSQIRDKIATLLEEIANPLRSAEVLQKIYGGDQRFRDGLVKLYIAILEALAEIVTWYTQQPRKRAFLKAALMGPVYKESVDTKTDSVKAAWTQFGNVANDCLHVNVASIGVSVASIPTMIANGFKNISDGLIAQIIWSNREEKRRRKQDKRTADLTMNESLPARKAGRECYKVVRSDGFESEKAIEMATNGENSSGYNSKQLQELLPSENIDEEYLKHAEEAVRRGGAGRDSFGSRAPYILNSRELKAWLESEGSTLLMVRGNNFENRSMTSPCSVATGLLVDQLQKFPKTIVLQYFCGLNRRSKNNAVQELNGVLHLARCLLQQLLLHPEVDRIATHNKMHHLSFLDEEKVEKMQSHSLSAYLKAISRLVKSFANDDYEVYILVDGIDEYSIGGGEFELKCQRVMEHLAKIVKWGNDGEGIAKEKRVVKILFTSVRDSRQFRDDSQVSDASSGAAQILYVPKSVASSAHVFNKNHWKRRCDGIKFYHLPCNKLTAS